MNRVRVGVLVSPSGRLFLDGRVLGATWGHASGLRQRYLLLDHFAEQAVAIPESRLESVLFVGLASRDVPPMPALPTDFVALTDVRQDSPIAGVLPKLEPLPAMVGTGRHVCLPGPPFSLHR